MPLTLLSWTISLTLQPLTDLLLSTCPGLLPSVVSLSSNKFLFNDIWYYASSDKSVPPTADLSPPITEPSLRVLTSPVFAFRLDVTEHDSNDVGSVMKNPVYKGTVPSSSLVPKFFTLLKIVSLGDGDMSVLPADTHPMLMANVYNDTNSSELGITFFPPFYGNSVAEVVPWRLLCASVITVSVVLILICVSATSFKFICF